MCNEYTSQYMISAARILAYQLVVGIVHAGSSTGKRGGKGCDVGAAQQAKSTALMQKLQHVLCHPQSRKLSNSVEWGSP